MPGEAIGLSALKAGNGPGTKYQLMLACVASFVVALASVAVIGPAFARTAYDGDWSVVIVTDGGACDASYRFGVQVAHGRVISDSAGGAAVQGQVAPTGVVKVIVRSGSEWARGFGRLGKNCGSGVWRGQGSSGACSGRWLAERRA